LSSTEKSDEELIGTYIKLRKYERECDQAIYNLLTSKEQLNEIIKEKFADITKDPDRERIFNARMSVKPEEIIELAEKLRRLQEDYKIAHEKLREFESKHPTIAREYGSHSNY
jgi:predicted patatin/cPLA2 family phospholipase